MTNAVYPCLKEKPVLISGGASGIGEAIVKSFAAQGARVGFVDLMEDAGAALASELRDAGHTVVFQRCDITDTEQYRRAIKHFEGVHGPCLVLVNNAANDTRMDWQKVTPEEFNRRIGVNLAHAFFAIQAVAPGMMAARQGSIINFGSISWMAAQAGIPVYTAAKAATHGMTRSFARELGQHNIRVNTVVPGWVMTKRQLDLWVDDAANELIDRSQCLAGRVQPQDLAAMVTFLASDSARMCSAQNFVVDGGWV
jgi:NAD(P)-dependent dehydrogenase (short-subunit alcohol dehydrogenase family)